MTKVGKKGRVIHIAHSQGALITSLAAKQLTPLEMSQIEVLAFGGAAALRKSPQTPFARVVNYYSVNDPLLLVVPPAAQALRSGFVGDDEFCFLAPRAGDPIRDHDLLGPTYATALAWEGKRFKRRYQPILYRTVRPMVLLLIAMAHSFDRRVHLILKAILKPLVKLIVLMYTWVEPWAQHVQSWVKERVLKPVLLVLMFIYRVVKELIRPLKGEEKYVPIQVAIDQAKR